MLALIWLSVGALLGFFVPRRAVAIGLSLAMAGIVGATLLAGRPEGDTAALTDSVGVLVLLGMAPAGVILGGWLHSRYPDGIAR